MKSERFLFHHCRNMTLKYWPLRVKSRCSYSDFMENLMKVERNVHGCITFRILGVSETPGRPTMDARSKEPHLKQHQGVLGLWRCS